MHLMRSNSNAHNVIPSQRFSFERKRITTSAIEGLRETLISSERFYFAPIDRIGIITINMIAMITINIIAITIIAIITINRKTHQSVKSINLRSLLLRQEVFVPLYYLCVCYVFVYSSIFFV